MFVRRGQATARLGAGLLLAMTCAAAPAIVLTAPAAGETTQCAPEAAPSASATSTELGGPVEITGDCFPTRTEGTVEIFIQGDEGSRRTHTVNTEGGESVYTSFTPEAAGEYQAVIEVGGETASTTFSVDPPAEDPEDPPTEEPTEEPTEDPTEQPTEDPTEEPTEEPTEVPTEEPTEEPTEDPTAVPTEEPTEQPTDAPTTPAPTDDVTEPAPSDDPTDPAATEEPTTSDPDREGPADDDPQGTPSLPTEPFPGTDQDQDEPAPSAPDRPSASAQEPDSPAPADPGSATEDDPTATPEHSADQKQAAALAVLMTSLFAHGVSEGEVGISPSEAGDSDEGGTSGGNGTADGSGASDGSGAELAETGAEVTVPAALAGLALISGASLLWLRQRRRG